MEESENDKQKEIDLMEKFNSPNYYNPHLFETCKREVLKIIKDCIFSFIAEKDRIKVFRVTSIPVLTKKIQLHLGIDLKEEEYSLNDDIALNILKKIREFFLNEEKQFADKICVFIYLYQHILYIKYDMIREIREVLEGYYNIYSDVGNCIDENGSWYDEETYHIIPIYNIEIQKWAEQEPSLQTVMKHYYQNEIEDAIKDLRELISDKNTKFKQFKDNQSKLVNAEIIGIYNRFSQIIHYLDKDEKIDNKQYEKMIESLNGMIKELKSIINDGDKKKEELTKDEIKIWLDLGLSIYRLYIISDNANKNQSNEKEEVVNDIGDEDIPF